MKQSLYADEILKVKTLLKEFERYSKKSLGQNFLINRQKIEFIVETAKKLNLVRLIEVGPGLGALTTRLQEVSDNFYLVELDDLFAQYWEDKGYKVIRGDALRIDWSKVATEPALLVSNLPYQIAARLVVDLSISPFSVGAMVLMFQKEVAQRMAAKFKSDDYGLITVISQTFWNVQVLTDLGPNDYYPPPKVASRVLTFMRKKGCEDLAKPQFLTFVKASFAQRRKYLKKNLLAVYKEDRILSAMAELSISPQVRPEDISVELYGKLYKLLSV